MRTLYHLPLSPFSRKVRLVLSEKRLPFDLRAEKVWERRAEYLELMFAAGKLGVIVCALNWRLADRQLAHCVNLATPRAIFVSPGFAAAARRIGAASAQMIQFGDDYIKS